MPPVRYRHGSFPPSNLPWARLVPYVGSAHAALARYDGVLGAIPNAQILLSPMTTQEAVLSSRIEGTITTMTEVLEYEAAAGGGVDHAGSEKVADFQEVLNYRRAILLAKDSLKKLPLSLRLLLDAHAVLMQGVRGKDKAPGAWRIDQNWIGPPGCEEDTAHFVPIDAARLLGGLSAWEKYLHQQQPDPLVQLAVAHAEFEALHPFRDGNGRLGRMIIPLFLFDRKLLIAPTFYLSGYLEARRDEYYERLMAVSRDGDWTGWCVFFLGALAAQAEANTRKAREILTLYETKKDWVVEQTHSQHAVRALDFLFRFPIFQSSDFVARASIPKPTATRILKVFRDEGLLTVFREPAGRRPAILGFPELLNLVEERDAF